MMKIKKYINISLCLLFMVVSHLVLPPTKELEIFPLFNWSLFTYSYPYSDTITLKFHYQENGTIKECYLRTCPKELELGDRRILSYNILHWHKSLIQNDLLQIPFFLKLQPPIDKKIISANLLVLRIDHTQKLSPQAFKEIKNIAQWNLND